MFVWYGKSRRPQHCRCPEARGGPYRMGVNGAYNTVGENVGALQYCLCQGVLQSTVSAGAQGMVPGIVV